MNCSTLVSGVVAVEPKSVALAVISVEMAKVVGGIVIVKSFESARSA